MLKDPAAAHYLSDLACQALFEYPGPARFRDLLHNVRQAVAVPADRLAEALEADPRFERVAGRWEVAARRVAEARPLGGALQNLLEAYGQPMPRSLLVSTLCLGRRGSPPQISELLDRLLATSPEVAQFDGCIYLRTWLATFPHTDDEGLLFHNGLSQDENFLRVRTKLQAAQHRKRQVIDSAEAVLAAAGRPLDNRALGLVLRELHGEKFDPPAVLAQMCCDDRFMALSGLRWALKTQEKAWLKAISAGGEGNEAVEKATDIERVLQSPPTQRLKLHAEQLLALQELAGAVRTPVEVAEAVTEVLGIRPRGRDFTGAIHAVEAVMAAETSLTRLRPGKYLASVGLPAWVRTVPEPLRVPAVPESETGDAPEELPEELAELVQDPLQEDVGEPVVAEGEEPALETQLIIPWHHHCCGTFFLRRRDMRFFGAPAGLSVITLVLPDGRRQPVWVNGETRLAYGLLGWYDEALPLTGALVTLRPTDEADVFAVEYTGETYAPAVVNEERLERLLQLREFVRRRRLTTTEIVRAVLQKQPKGLDFDRLWTQTNIIQRMTRHQVAWALVRDEGLVDAGKGKWRVE